MREDQGFVGGEVAEAGRRVTRFFTDEAEADEAVRDSGRRAALRAIGA